MTPGEQRQSVWTEVSLRVRPDAVEAVSEVVAEFTGAGAVIEPAIEALGPDEGYVLDAVAPQIVKGYVYGRATPAERAAFRRRLAGAGLGNAIVGRTRWRTLREEDWANSWKDYFQVERVGRVVVRPAWRDYTAAEGEVVVSLDPGMAFGTGQHPTTRMCLLALQDFVSAGARVLDLGTGSGILALAAVALGARECLALDIEKQAVDAARANAGLNGLQDRVRVEHRGLDPGVDGPFDLLLANIHAGAIVALAGALARVAVPGAALLAGGVIEQRLGEVEAALAAAGFETESVLSDGDWRTLIARRDAASP